MPEDENEILTTLQQDTFKLSPRFQKKLSLLDKVRWTFAILIGRYRGKQVPLACNANDALMVASDAADFPEKTSLPVDAAKNGTRELIAAPGAGYELWIYGGIFTGSAIGTAKFQDSTPTAKTGEIRFAAQGGFTREPKERANQWWFKCAENKALQVVLSADLDLDGEISYRTVAV